MRTPELVATAGTGQKFRPMQVTATPRSAMKGQECQYYARRLQR